MARVRVCSWNIEHMHDWFDDTEANVVSAYDGIATKVANVIQAIDPDIICIQEGPTRKHQMENYFSNFLGSGWTVVRGETGGSQKPYILFRDFTGLQDFSEIDFDATAWKFPFLKHDEDEGVYNLKAAENFSRLPAEVLFTTTEGTFSVMCLHMKSKISFFSSNATSTDSVKRTRGIAEGLEQRARILQEATLLRDYVQNYAFESEVEPRSVIMGDLNDGPGVDYFEKRFFSTDLMRRIRGDIDHPDQIMTDLVDRGAMDKRFTAIFYDKLDKELRHLLLDHILALPDFVDQEAMRVIRNTARIEHDKYLAENEGDWTKKKKPTRKKYPSDHRPMSVSIEY